MQVLFVSQAEIGRGFGAVTLIEMCGNTIISGAVAWIDMYGDLKNTPWAVLSTGESFTHFRGRV